MTWAIYWVFTSPWISGAVVPANEYAGVTYGYSSFKECMVATSVETESFELIMKHLGEKHPLDKHLIQHISDYHAIECRMVADAQLF